MTAEMNLGNFERFENILNYRHSAQLQVGMWDHRYSEWCSNLALKFSHEDIGIRSTQNESGPKRWGSYQDAVNWKDHDVKKMNPQVVNYLWRTYATDKHTADAADETIMFTQPTNEIPSQYAEELIAKALRCGDICEEHALKAFFFKGQEKSNR